MVTAECMVMGDMQYCYCIMYGHWRHAVLLLHNVWSLEACSIATA